MPFIGAIAGAIASAIGAIGSAIGAIATAVGSAVGSAIISAASVVGSVFKEIGQKVGGALGAMFHVAGTVLAEIDSNIAKTLDTVNKVTTTVDKSIQSFLKPIQELFGTLNQVLTSINKDYVAVSALTAEIKADVHNGIQGLIAIPGAISGALTNIDAVTGRAFDKLQAGQTDIATKVLVPGIGDKVSNSVGTVADLLKPITASNYNLPEDFGKEALAGCPTGSYADFVAQMAKKYFPDATDWLTKVGHVIIGSAAIADYLVASVHNIIRCVEQQANRDNPVEAVSPQDAVEAMYRGTITRKQAEAEAANSAINPSRFDLLAKNALWLPGVRETLQLYYRGAIDKAGADALLEKLKVDKTIAEAVDKAFLEPINPREAMQMENRIVLGKAGFLKGSLGSDPPGDALRQYQMRFVDPAVSYYDWAAHWDIPDMDWWLTGWARGVIDEKAVRDAATIRNIPAELHDALFPVWQEIIPLWLLPDVLGAGQMSESEAIAYAQKIGIEPESAKILVQYGLSKAKATVGALGAQLAGISATNAREMYVDGIINEATYLQLLIDHGYTQEAAQLTVDLENQKQALAARKTYVTNIIAEVDAGLITEQQMIDDLYAKGYTPVEVATATNKVKSAKVAKAKLPTRAELTDMLKVGVLTGDQWLSYMQQIGYAVDVAMLYYNLEVAQHGQPQNPITTTGGS